MLADSVRETVLENGLKVLTLEDPTSPTASLCLFYRVGSRNERTGITGISHIFEHLMFKGTKRYPGGAFDRIVQENGMSYNAFTTNDYTGYYECMASSRVEIACELEADRMQGLDLSEEAFQSELAVIREERRQTVEDPPFGLLSEEVDATAFQVHPYHWPIIGWMSDLETIGLQDVQQYYRNHYRPNNAVLVLAGDLEHERALEMIRRHFGNIPRGPELAVATPSEPPQRGERTVTVRKEVQLPGIILAYRGPEAARRETRVLNVIEFLLMHGRSSRLYQRLIYQKQLVTGISGGLQVRIDPSLFRLRARARPGVSVETLRDEITAALEELRDQPVTEAELRKVRRALEADFIFSQESHLELAQELGEEECRTSWRNHLSWLEENLSVTPEEIQRVAGEVFDERRRTIGYLLPEGDRPPDGESDESGPREF